MYKIGIIWCGFLSLFIINELAFRLSDLGYDVWLGNTRGNIYSRKHAWLDIDTPEYWQFS